MKRSRSVLAAALVVALGLQTAPARAQEPLPNWVGDLTSLSANALLSGLSAGVMQKVRGGSFQDGFTRGALGGGVIYWGKRLAVQDFRGAGFVGREVAAVGSSITRNAAEARPTLERLALPVGPVWLYLSPGSRSPVTAKLDLATMAAVGFAVASPELEWDVEASLSAGAPVFEVDSLLLKGKYGHELGAAGITRAGAIFLSDIAGLEPEVTFKHERVHLIQHDQYFMMWADPAEEWLLDRVPGGDWVGRYVDLNLSPLVTVGLSQAFKNRLRRPWELEAEHLSRR